MTPLFLKDSVLTIAATGYEAEVSSATFTPSTSSATWKGLTPDAVFTNTSNATWTVELTYAQDPDDALSLGMYLFEHEGEEVACQFTPQVGCGRPPSFACRPLLERNSTRMARPLGPVPART